MVSNHWMLCRACDSSPCVCEDINLASGISDEHQELVERIESLEHTFRHTFQSPLPSSGDRDCERCKTCGLNIRDAIHSPA